MAKRVTVSGFCAENEAPDILVDHAGRIYRAARRRLGESYASEAQHKRLEAASVVVAAKSISHLRNFGGNALGVSYGTAQACDIPVIRVEEYFDIKFGTLNKAVNDIVSYMGMRNEFYGVSEYRGLKRTRRQSD